jgi:hypothetical protein
MVDSVQDSWNAGNSSSRWYSGSVLLTNGPGSTNGGQSSSGICRSSDMQPSSQHRSVTAAGSIRTVQLHYLSSHGRMSQMWRLKATAGRYQRKLFHQNYSMQYSYLYDKQAL